MLFQSTPDQQTGRYGKEVIDGQIRKGFNPRPINRPGDTWPRLRMAASISCFNPRPINRPGDTDGTELQ